MKKIMLGLVTLFASLAFVSCGTKTSTDDTIEALTDSIEMVTDSVVAPVQVVVDSATETVIDTVKVAVK